MEVFKDIKGYEGLYQISNFSRVKSIKFEEERILKVSKTSSGYLTLNLYKEGKIKSFSLHQLMAIAFLGHTPGNRKLVVDHKNNIKTDNRLKNLQVITQRENISKDRYRGTSKYIGVGKPKGSTKWTAQIFIDGKVKYLGSFEDELEAAKAYQEEFKKIKHE